MTNYGRKQPRTTKIVPEGRRYQARYYDRTTKVWFDIGDPKDTREQAQALATDYEARKAALER